MNLTILIIAKNAEETIERTLQSVIGLKSKIIVVDDYSNDKTTHIARKYCANIISHHEENFGRQRIFALSQVKTVWTLVLDCDEVLSQENRDEIIYSITDKKFEGYNFRFRNYLFGKKLEHGEVHKKMILFITKSAYITSPEVHEHFKLIEGKAEDLKTEILHNSYRNLWQVIWKFFTYYTVRTAIENKKTNKKHGLKHLILYPLHMFYARFIKDEGYKDGPARLFLDLQFAQMEFLSYFLIPFVNAKPRISVDCGAYPVGGRVQSGIDRLIQGIFMHQSKEYDYYWFGFAETLTHRLPKRFFSQLWLPIATILRRSDIFLGVSGTIPHLLKYFPVKKILFLYDFGFYSSEDKYKGSAQQLQNQTNSSVRIADKIVLLNEESYKEFIQRFPLYAHKAEIVLSGADHLENIEEKPVFIQDKKPMILYVGVVKPVKQIDVIIRAVGNHYCVIAGPQEEAYKKSLHVEKSQSIQFIKNFSDGQLKWLYKRADVMVYTSKHEGFCYPVLEALISGLPVIALQLPIFSNYQEYFPYLTLVKNEEEMGRVLKSKSLKVQSQKYQTVIRTHPYLWKSFTEKLLALWQPAGLPRLNRRKMAFIVVLYKTPTEEKIRLENEIKQIGIAQYEIYWIDNSTNGNGYAAGINEGIRKGLMDGCEDFIALNPDISLQNITANIISNVSSEFDVWGLAMKQQNTVYYGGEIDRWRLSGGLITNKQNMKFADVDFVSGSLLGFSREVIRAIGLWDESYFMYYEDVDYCIRAKKKGFQVGIDTETVYDHFELSQQNKKKDRWIAKARWRFFWKYANAKQIIREIMRLPKTLLSKYY